VFRDEPVRAGRTRQFTQCDADIIGDVSVNADVECLALVADILKNLNIKADFVVNNRKLINAIIASVQIKSSRQVLRELDKLDKLDLDQVKSNLRKFASANQIVTLFKLLQKNLSFFRQNAFEGADELFDLIQLGKHYGLSLKASPSLVRGFSYYSGNVFEVSVPAKKTVLMAGGRYDGAVGKFSNRVIPAVGISFSLEALFGLCEEQLSQISSEVSPKVLVISIDHNAESIKLARTLRKSGVSCVISYDRPGNALAFANAYAIPFVAFLGSDEVSKNKVKLKNMMSGKESLLSEKQFIIAVRK